MIYIAIIGFSRSPVGLRTGVERGARKADFQGVTLRVMGRVWDEAGGGAVGGDVEGVGAGWGGEGIHSAAAGEGEGCGEGGEEEEGEAERESAAAGEEEAEDSGGEG